tara:strand:- start:7048 stop:7221 length:174 start_codon:yes stop_codon:yes gene_type:complete
MKILSAKTQGDKLRLKVQTGFFRKREEIWMYQNGEVTPLNPRHYSPKTEKFLLKETP